VAAEPLIFFPRELLPLQAMGGRALALVATSARRPFLLLGRRERKRLGEREGGCQRKRRRRRMG
jgi:hypothetical protein